MEKVEKGSSTRVVIVNIKEWIASIFPVIPVPPTHFHNPKRDAVINLVSIGELAKAGLEQIVDPDSFGMRKRVEIGSVMLGAYGEVLMAEYGIEKSELRSDAEILQMVKDVVGKS